MSDDTQTLTGHAAITHAKATGRPLSKYATPTEDAREGLTVEEARDVAALIYLEIGVAGDLEIWEDNGGGVWLVAEAEGIAVEMPRDGDALTDARTYRLEWTPEDFEENYYAIDDTHATSAQSLHVATYRIRDDELVMHVEPEEMWHGSREYLRASLADEPMDPAEV